jgi:cytochrome c peroxidase
LFFDPRMSPVGYIACVTCHAPDRSFADLKPRAHGLADLERNTIALANVRQQRWFDWAGSSDSLWLASLRPILNPREFDGSPASVARLFQRDEELARCFRRVFGVAPSGNDERTLVNVGKALAAFVETLQTGRTSFDEYRDAIVSGKALPGSYPAAAVRGLKLFVGRADCASCHSGPNFSDGRFHDVGAPPPIAPARRDPGRAEGARLLLESPFNLLGRYGDDPRAAHASRAQVVADRGRIGEFRTPSLRNVAVTGPYMHNGRVELLTDAVRQHTHQVRLDDAEVADLVAFLLTLTDRDGERRPVPPTVDGCISSSGPIQAATAVARHH